MSIEFNCSQCGRLLRTGDDTAGKTAQCPQCSALITVPDVQANANAGSEPLNPFTPGTAWTPAYQPATDSGYAARRVNAPAICLMLYAGLGLLLWLVGSASNAMRFGPLGQPFPAEIDRRVMMGVLVTSSFMQFVCMLLTLVGGLQMLRLRSYPLAWAAAIIAIIPCFSPCCLLGMPLGVWAIVVLSDPAVRSGFGR